MEPMVKHPKTRDTKQAHIFNRNCEMFKKISHYTIQKVNCVLDYSKKTFQILVQIILYTSCGDINLERKYKSGHVDM